MPDFVRQHKGRCLPTFPSCELLGWVWSAGVGAHPIILGPLSPFQLPALLCPLLPPSLEVGLWILLGWQFPVVGVEVEVGSQGEPEPCSCFVFEVCKDETSPASAARDRPAVPITQEFHMWLLSGAHAGT